MNHLVCAFYAEVVDLGPYALVLALMQDKISL